MRGLGVIFAVLVVWLLIVVLISAADSASAPLSVCTQGNAIYRQQARASEPLIRDSIRLAKLHRYRAGERDARRALSLLSGTPMPCTAALGLHRSLFLDAAGLAMAGNNLAEAGYVKMARKRLWDANRRLLFSQGLLTLKVQGDPQ